MRCAKHAYRAWFVCSTNQLWGFIPDEHSNHTTEPRFMVTTPLRSPWFSPKQSIISYVAEQNWKLVPVLIRSPLGRRNKDIHDFL